MLKNTRNRINARLKMLYDMMPECDCMGDVGTDHGFLPIYCVINGKCKSAVASDLREGPLKIADSNKIVLRIKGIPGAGMRRRRNRGNGRIYNL